MIKSLLTYSEGARLRMEWAAYANGQRALVLRDATTGEPVCKATVAVDVPVPDGCLAIKNWSENEGVAQTLLEAGVIIGEPVGGAICGFEMADFYELADDYKTDSI